MMNEEIRERVHRYLINQTDFLKVKDKLSEDQLRMFVNQSISDLCQEQNLEVPSEQRMTLIREFQRG